MPLPGDLALVEDVKRLVAGLACVPASSRASGPRVTSLGEHDAVDEHVDRRDRLPGLRDAAHR